MIETPDQLSVFPSDQNLRSRYWSLRTYVSPLAACDSYVPGEYIVLDDDAGFVVRKNGRDAGHGVIRARMHEIEKGGCRYPLVLERGQDRLLERRHSRGQVQRLRRTAHD